MEDGGWRKEAEAGRDILLKNWIHLNINDKP